MWGAVYTFSFIKVLGQVRKRVSFPDESPCLRTSLAKYSPDSG